MADRVLAAVVRPSHAPPRPAAPRVLVIRCDHLGDATLSTAPLQAIRDALKPSQMDIAAGPWASAVFQGHPAIDEVLEVTTPWWLPRNRGFSARVHAWFAVTAFMFEVRRRKYDIGIDLRGDLRHFLWFFVGGGIPERISSDRTGGATLLTSCASYHEGIHEVARTFAIAETVGAAAQGRPTLSPEPLAASRRSALGLPERFIAIAARGASPNRQWPSEHVAELTRLVFSQLGLPVVYVGSDADQEHAAQVGLRRDEGFIDLAGQTTVGELISVLAEAELVVAVDTGPMHVAAALGRPIVAIWGPTPVDWLPYSDDAIVVRAEQVCECSGPTCSLAQGAGRCHRTLMAARVYAAVSERLQRRATG